MRGYLGKLYVAWRVVERVAEAIATPGEWLYPLENGFDFAFGGTIGVASRDNLVTVCRFRLDRDVHPVRQIPVAVKILQVQATAR